MISSHSHSGAFCLHAKSSHTQILTAAHAKGFHTYALTEHIPRLPEFLYPEEPACTNLPALFLAFISSAQRARIEFKGRITVLVGLETEYIQPGPGEINTINTLVTAHALDFVVTSLHHINTVPIDYSAPLFASALASFSSYQDLINVYLDHQHDLISGIHCRQVIGHFDLFRLYGGDRIPFTREMWRRIERNVDLIVSVGALVEINTRSWKKGLRDPYPCREIVKVCVWGC
jgi:histidinol-phosphatase (PHP family)